MSITDPGAQARAKKVKAQQDVELGCGKSTDVECITEVSLMPLIYCAIADENQEGMQKLTPDLPADLGTRLLKPLAKARYGVSLLRPGYFYVYVKRAGEEMRCETAIKIHHNGELKAISPSVPEGIGVWDQFITIRYPLKVEKCRMLFTPDQLTDRMLKVLAEDEELAKVTMQEFNIKALMSNPKGKDVLQVDKIVKHVTEAIVSKENADAANPFIPKEPGRKTRPATSVWGRHLFSGSIDALFAKVVIKLRDMEKPQKAGKSFAVVLDDAIGITQVLNTWRNAALEDPLRNWLAIGDNERKLMVANELENLQRKYQANEAYKDLVKLRHDIFVQRKYSELHKYSSRPTITSNIPRDYELFKKEEEIYFQGKDPERSRNVLRELEEKMWRAAGGTYSKETAARYNEKDYNFKPNESLRQYNQYREEVDEAELKFKVKLDTAFKDQYLGSFERDIGKHVDMERARAHQGEFNKKCVEAEALAKGRIADHKKWGLSEQLYAALEVYDDSDQANNFANGWKFSKQTELCFIGSDGMEGYQETFSRWWKGDPKDRHNLGLRSLALNQGKIVKELIALDKKVDAAHKHWTTEEKQSGTDKMLVFMRDQIKTLSKLYKQADKCFDVLNSERMPETAHSFWLASMGRRLFERKIIIGEKKLFGRLFAYQAGNIGAEAIAIRLEAERAAAAAENRITERRRMAGIGSQGKYYRNYIPTEMARYMDANSTQFYKMRSGALFLCFEAALLIWKWNDQPAEWRDKNWKVIGGSVASLVGQGMSLWSDAQSMISKGMAAANAARATKAKQAAADAADYLSMKWKLWGAGLMMLGSTLSGVLAWDAAKKEEKLHNQCLHDAYIIYSVTMMAGALGYSGVILAGLKKSLECAVKRNNKALFRLFLSLSNFLSKQAVLRFLTVGLVRICGWWVSTAILVIIMLTSDSALRVWTKRCSFAKNPNGTPNLPGKPVYVTEDPYKDAGEELSALYAAVDQ